jgi:hypothetical protein
MRLNARLLTAVLPAPVLVAGLMYLASAGAQPTNTQELSDIPQPQEWVPFAGQFLTTEPGRPDIVGKYYRSDDGSFREEQHAVDGSVAAISISNIAEASAYLYISRRGDTWVKQPMLLRPAGFKPQLRRSSMQGLTKHPRVVLGFDAYDYVEPTGTRHIQVPALNFFSISREKPSGERRVYHSLVVGLQPEELFRPPQGAVVEYNSKPIPNGVPVTALSPPAP